jgi:IclR family KDG regulon transcriptional repressor
MARRVPAVERALDILELFLRTPQPESLSVPEIARALGLPRSTAHELVATLVARRYLRPIEGNPHRFALDARVFELGNAYASGLDLAREGQQVAREIAARCDETVHIAVLEGETSSTSPRWTARTPCGWCRRSVDDCQLIAPQWGRCCCPA